MIPVSNEEWTQWKPWKMSLVVKIVGRKVNFRLLENKLNRIWAKGGRLQPCVVRRPSDGGQPLFGGAEVAAVLPYECRESAKSSSVNSHSLASQRTL